MCGSNDLVKQDGVFVCQNCFTKYSIEEAKKMMMDGVVEITGTINLDTTKKEKSLIDLLESEIKAENYIDAYQTASKLIELNSKIWQAWIYKAVSLSRISEKNGYQLNESIVCFEKAYELLMTDGLQNAGEIIAKNEFETLNYLLRRYCEAFVANTIMKTSDNLSKIYNRYLEEINRIVYKYRVKQYRLFEMENGLSETFFLYLQASKRISDEIYQKTKRIEKDYSTWSNENFIITTKTVFLLNGPLTPTLLQKAYDFLDGLIQSQLTIEYYTWSSLFNDYTNKKKVSRSMKKILIETLDTMNAKKSLLMEKARAREAKYLALKNE